MYYLTWRCEGRGFSYHESSAHQARAGDAAPQKPNQPQGLVLTMERFGEAEKKAAFIIQNKPKTKKMFPIIKEREKAANMLLRFMMGLII